ncbi:AAA family ATPase, partial [Nocardiopsis sp. TNDT3]|uniref:AAA family ATPase n=1 Tax=Nocardiopsis sp. TNDT3 TaxID=2249354 RepID=UPI0013002D02
MSDPPPQTPPRNVHNTLTGNPSGTVVQAGTVHGGVGNTTHIHQGPVAPKALDAVPGPPDRFIGRAQDLEQITARLDPATTPRSVVVSVLSGMGGVGKTALALKAAQVAWASGWFCAHLFVDLRGYAPGAEPLSAEAALDVLLRQMGVNPQDIPAGAQERASFYRSALASLTGADEQGRPVLIVADNANSVSQVRPLLPGPGGHRLVATSREG